MKTENEVTYTVVGTPLTPNGIATQQTKDGELVKLGEGTVRDDNGDWVRKSTGEPIELSDIPGYARIS